MMDLRGAAAPLNPESMSNLRNQERTYAVATVASTPPAAAAPAMIIPLLSLTTIEYRMSECDHDTHIRTHIFPPPFRLF
jgi:hypothetical protein